MINRIILKFILIIVLSNCSAQNNAFVIKHTGMTDAYIFPIVFQKDTLITQEFSDRYLKTKPYFQIKTKYVNIISLSDEELINLKKQAFLLIEAIGDSTTFSNQKGSFDFIWIENNTIKKSVSVNDGKTSIRLLNQILEGLDYNIQSNIEIYDTINALLKNFVQNATLEIIGE